MEESRINMIERTFITVYSFSNFYGQMNQEMINQFITVDIDFAIFLLSASDNEVLGPYTRQEIDTVLNNDIPYKVFLKRCDDIQKNKQAEDTIKQIVKNNFYGDISEIDEDLKRIAKSIVRKRVDESTWSNDNFAFYTIEARMRETFDIYLNQFGKKFEEFLNSPVFGTNEIDEIDNINIDIICEDKRNMLNMVSGEIYDITANYQPTVYGEYHYGYLRRIPFLVAEFYFYFYILYLYLIETKNNSKTDPFWDTKINKTAEWLAKGDNPTLRSYNSLLNSPKNDFRIFRNALFHCVNTNSSDLSQLRLNHERVGNRLLIDNTKEIFNYLDKIPSSKKIVYILDNCGEEFISDLLFACYLIKYCGYTEVECCVKELPIFVSDTTINDVEYVLNHDKIKPFLKGGKYDNKTKCLKYLNGMIYFTSLEEWHKPKYFKDSESFKQWNNDDNIGLIILKGDLNYRRLVGDKNYDYFDKIEDKMDYAKKPILILRSLKSNVVLGIDKIDLNRVKPNWKISGEYGIVHFINIPKSSAPDL